MKNYFFTKKIECSSNNKKITLSDFTFSNEVEIIIGDKTRESTLFFNEISHLKLPFHHLKEEPIPEGAYIEKEFIFWENTAYPLTLKNFVIRKRRILFQPKHLFKRMAAWFYVLLQKIFFGDKNSNYLLSRILNLITNNMWDLIEEKHKKFFVMIFQVMKFLDKKLNFCLF